MWPTGTTCSVLSGSASEYPPRSVPEPRRSPVASSRTVTPTAGPGLPNELTRKPTASNVVPLGGRIGAWHAWSPGASVAAASAGFTPSVYWTLERCVRPTTASAARPIAKTTRSYA